MSRYYWLCRGINWLCRGINWLCRGINWLCRGINWLCRGIFPYSKLCGFTSDRSVNFPTRRLNLTHQVKSSSLNIISLRCKYFNDVFYNCTPGNTAMKLINLFRLQAYCLGDPQILGFYFAIKFVVLIMRISNLKKKIPLHSWRWVFVKILKMLKVFI